MPDGPENAIMAHATGVIVVPMLPFAMTCFEFTSIRHEESSEVEEASHCVDSRVLICFCCVRFRASALTSVSWSLWAKCPAEMKSVQKSN